MSDARPSVAELVKQLNEATEEDGMCCAERCFERNPLRLCPDGSVCSCCDGCACVEVGEVLGE